MFVGGVFDVLGEDAASDVMEQLSDAASDYADELEGVSEEDTTEDQQEAVREMISRLTKGLRLYEALGEPSLDDALEAYEGDDLDDDEDDQAAA
jgi:hypothetical protein